MHYTDKHVTNIYPYINFRCVLVWVLVYRENGQAQICKGNINITEKQKYLETLSLKCQLKQCNCSTVQALFSRLINHKIDLLEALKYQTKILIPKTPLKTNNSLKKNQIAKVTFNVLPSQQRSILNLLTPAVNDRAM